jgi:peptidoglycan hydrolase CwlO-like protein
MKKIFILSCAFLLVSEAFIASIYAGSGGDAAVGGFAGGMVGGLMSGAITKGSSDSGSRRSSAKMMRELNKLEDAVAHDLRKLDERINSLSQEVDKLKNRDENADVASLIKDNKELKNSVKELRKSIDDKFEEFDDRFAALEKGIKKLENKTNDKIADQDSNAIKEKDMNPAVN